MPVVDDDGLGQRESESAGGALRLSFEAPHRIYSHHAPESQKALSDITALGVLAGVMPKLSIHNLDMLEIVDKSEPSLNLRSKSP